MHDKQLPPIHFDYKIYKLSQDLPSTGYRIEVKSPVKRRALDLRRTCNVKPELQPILALQLTAPEENIK